MPITNPYEAAAFYPEFTKDEIDLFWESFQNFDADHSGGIDLKELDHALKEMGQGVQKEELELLMELADEEKKGYIDWADWLEVMRFFYPWKRIHFVQNFLEPAKDFPEFTRTDIAVFIEAFREFDLDGSGSIDADELEACFKKMGQGATRKDVENILRLIGADKNGEIQFPGFLRLMRYFYPWKVIEFKLNFLEPAKAFPEFTKADIKVFIQAFREFDLDESQSIDADELQIAFEKMGMGYSRETIQKVIDQVDLDGSGEIEWIEFLLIMRLFYPERLQEFEDNFLIPAKQFTEFTPEEIDVFITAFREFDEDGSNTIDERELGNVLSFMGQGTSPEKVRSIIRNITGGSLEIEWPQFLQLMSNIYHGRSLDSTSREKPGVQQTTTQKVAAQSTQTVQPTPQKTATPPKSNPTPAKPISSPATKPASSPATKPTLTTSTGAQKTNPKCEACGKTVYAVEAISAIEKTWHKGCFKCQEEGCGLTLNLKTYVGVEGRIYCAKHKPVNKPSQVSSLVMQSAINAPKPRRQQGVKKNARMTFAPGTLSPINPENP